MPVNRIVLLVLIVGGLALFSFSNLSPVVPLVFLGRTTAALPLAAWIGGAIAAGAITSFFLQFLSYLQRSDLPRSREEANEVPPRTRSFYRESQENPAPESQTRYTPPPPPPPQTSTSSDASDWEEPVNEDWDFDEEPVAPASNQKDFDQERPIGTPRADSTSYEVKQDPKTGYKSGSVYSYSYREPKESGVGRTETVYDANFRVIMPPYQKPAEPEPEEDDDWGFEDDEEFNDESKSKPKRR